MDELTPEQLVTSLREQIITLTADRKLARQENLALERTLLRVEAQYAVQLDENEKLRAKIEQLQIMKLLDDLH
jgi:hypothetical protein